MIWVLTKTLMLRNVWLDLLIYARIITNNLPGS